MFDVCVWCVCVCTICMRIGRPLFIPFHIHWKDSLDDDDDDDPEFSFFIVAKFNSKESSKDVCCWCSYRNFFPFRFEKVGMLNTRKFVVCVCLCVCVVYPFILMFVFFLLWSFLFMYKWQQLTITFLFFSCFVQFCIIRNGYGWFSLKENLFVCLVWVCFSLCVCVWFQFHWSSIGFFWSFFPVFV